MSSWLPEKLREEVARRANWLCEYCLISEADTYLGCEVDHVISEKHGGKTTSENLAYACFSCNRHKGTDVAAIAFSGDAVRLFNPRHDFWGDHFHLRGGRIEWKTAIGEATVRLLGLNDFERILERELLMMKGNYPNAAAKMRIHK